MRVLIQACSNTKIDTLEPVPAINRYDGSAWRVIRKYLRENGEDSGDLLILALSAEFGLIESSFAIPDYNRRMTPERARELQIVVSRQWSELTTATGVRPRGVMINVGRDYLPALEQIDFSNIGNVKFAAGGIGERNGQIKSWLRTGRT